MEFGIQGLGFGIWREGVRFPWKFRVQGPGLTAQSSGVQGQGGEFRGSWVGVQGV